MKLYDFILIIATIAILAALGVISLAGSGYAWLASGGSAAWNATPAYQDYIGAMNTASGPFFVALALALALCIPKRIVARRTLIAITLALFAAGVGAGLVAGITIGIGVLLIGAMVMQFAVVVLTAMGSKRLHFLTEGFFSQLGSGLLHLGLVVLLYDVMLLRETTLLHTVAFWSATACIVMGMTLALYQKELTRVFPHRRD